MQICISDDCSPSDLRTPVLQFMQNYDVELIFNRNENNLGFDLNVLKSVELATARYCWIFGDDDGMPPGKLDLLLSYFEKYPEVDVFFGNHYLCNRNLKIMMKEHWTKDREDFFVDFTQADEIRTYFDKLNTTTCLGYFALIVKKEAWDSITEQDYMPFIPSIYIQVAKYLLILYKKGKMYRITDCIVLTRCGYDNFFKDLKARIYMDLKGFLKLSVIFDDNPVLKDSFLGIVRRHFNNIFLYAMSYTSQLNEKDISILRQIGYPQKQINIFLKHGRIYAFFGFVFSVIKSMFTDFNWFYMTCRKTLQKLVVAKG